MSEKRKGSNAYEQLLKDVYNQKKTVNVISDRNIILRSLREQNFNGDKLLFGKISRFTKLDSNDWLNILSMEAETFDIPDYLFPNLSGTDYFFFPSKHRFFLRVKQGTVSITNCERFLVHSLNEISERDEEVVVEVEKDSDVFDEIWEAQQIKSIYVNVNYSNNDNNDDSERFMDESLKRMNAGSYEMTIKSDHTQSINLNEPIVEGSLMLSQKNGRAKVNLVDKHGVKRVIETSDHPEKIKIRSDENQINDEVVKEMRKRYQSRDD